MGKADLLIRGIEREHDLRRQDASEHGEVVRLKELHFIENRDLGVWTGQRLTREHQGVRGGQEIKLQNDADTH